MRYGMAVVALFVLLGLPATDAHAACDRQQAEQALTTFDEAVSSLSESAQERFLELHARELDLLEAAEEAKDWSGLCEILSGIKVPPKEQGASPLQPDA